ncbi:4522_t:CDS:2 [Rhizophagus irregularis]|nr:4522_t:CDS:2 [Rhizophagus irregularis]
MSKYYVALSQDGQEVAIFDSTKLELSTCTIDRLDKQRKLAYEPFQVLNSNLFDGITWSISISNKSANGEVLIALSCFNKYRYLMSEDQNSAQYFESIKRQSICNIITDITDTTDTSDTNETVETLTEMENGEMASFDSTWLFSTLNKERIRTTIDHLGGIVKFLSPSDPKKQTLIIIHDYGITKTLIPINYRQYNNNWNSLRKTFFNKLIAKNSKGTIEFYFPMSISKQIKACIEDRPQLNIFNKNIKNNYLFLQDSKSDKLNMLECYNLEGGGLIKSFQEFTNINDIIYIQFICNDEKLLIIGEREVRGSHVIENSDEIEVVKIRKKKSMNTTVPILIIWDLFSSNSVEDSITIIHDSLNSLDIFRHYHNYVNSNGNTIYIDKKGTVKSLLDHPDLIDALKKSMNYFLKPLDIIVAQEISGSMKKHAIFHLDNILDSHTTENDAIVIYSEPWISNKKCSRISVFLNEDKSIQLIIGVFSVQVWRRLSEGDNQVSRLEYIWIGNKQKIEIKSLLVERNEFLLEFTLHDEKEDLPDIINKKDKMQIHWPHNVLILKDACVALEYCHYLIDNPVSPRKGLLFEEFRIQVQNIVKNFIKYNPLIFQLTDIRYDIMGNLIRGNCVSIIKRILFIKTENFKSSEGSKAMKAKMNNHLHFPRLYSWESNSPKKSDLEVAIESITGVHRKESIIVGYLLDYYSDNAMKNTGWMISVTQILPLLYDRHLDYYVKELFYKPCFGTRQSYIDDSLISSYELRKAQQKNIHSINIRQGLSRKPSAIIPGFKKKFEDIKMYLKLNLNRKHDPCLTKLNVVPLPDFFTFPPSTSTNKEEKFLDHYLAWRILKNVVWPHIYVELVDSQYSPFHRALMRDNRITTFSNPSLAALIDYKWSKAQIYFIRSYATYIIFALIFWTTNNVTRIEVVTPIIAKGIYFPLQIMLFYIGYLRLAFEYLQLKNKGYRKYINVYNFFDIISIIMPLSLVISLNFLESGVDKTKLRYYTVAASLTTFVLWIELLLLLRFFSDLVPDGGQNFALFNAVTGDNIAPNITIDQTFDVDRVSDNYFSDFLQSIEAVYFWTNGRWDQVDQWNFLPVQALCFFASILLITVMQNMLIAYMTSVFDEACALGNQAVLKFRADLICDYETLMRFVVDLIDESENPKDLYYVARVEEVERWESEIKKYSKSHKYILVDKFDSLSDDEESDNSDDEKENKSEINVKGKGIRYSGSTKYSGNIRSIRPSVNSIA